MMIKPKSIIVIVFSSAIISLAILLTVVATSLYAGWREGESVKLHRDRIAALNARFYGQFITIQDLKAEYNKKTDTCVLQGILKNTGYRTVNSLKLEIEFLNKNGDIIYVERLYPLKATLPPQARTVAALALFASGRERALIPNGELHFTHPLGEQKDKDITSPIKYKKYATNPNEWSGELKNAITRVRF